MGKTFKDVRKDYKIVDHRYRKKDKRRKILDEATKIDEVGRDGHLDNTDSPTRDTRGLGSQDEYDTLETKDEGPIEGFNTTSRESTRNVRDIGPLRQDRSRSRGRDN